VHQASQGTKYNIRAHDSVIGATSREVRDKILKQIPLDPRPAAAKTIHRSQVWITHQPLNIALAPTSFFLIHKLHKHYVARTTTIIKQINTAILR